MRAMRSRSPAPAVGGEPVAGVPEVVEVQPRHAECLDRVRPAGELTEVVPPKRNAFDTGEDERKIILPSKKGSLHRNRGGS
jgi:hypothetical protein